MHSLARLAVLGCVLGGGVRGAVLQAPSPTITPAPSAEEVDMLLKRQDPDAVSLALILLTAIPLSLRKIAATNVPAVSSILWEEFLGDERPEWFLELPQDIQDYLIRQFGPTTAWSTEASSSSWSWEGSAPGSVSVTQTSVPVETSSAQQSGTTEGASQTSSSATGTTPPQQPGSSTSVESKPLVSSTTTSADSTETPSSTQGSLRSNSRTPSSTPSPTSTPDSPTASSEGLTKSQKISLGVGIPLGILGAVALFFGCCIFLRRRHKKNVDGSIPPSSPGFIPHFAFQDRTPEDVEHRAPLTREVNASAQDLGPTEWDEEGVDPMEAAPMRNPYTLNNPFAMSTPYTMNDIGMSNSAGAGMTAYDIAPVHHAPNAGMAMHDAAPIMAPALFHTHSSNRARGMRTSYTSLHSVAEVSEPDDTESPILGRQTSPRRNSARSLIPTPPTPAGAQIKRKPIGSSPPPMPTSPPIVASLAANEASRRLLRQTMPEHSGSSSSGLALSTSSGFNTSNSSGLGDQAEATSPVSPISARAPSNPFSYDSYIEDYGPEYQGEYVDVDDSLYGGHTSLSRYPEPRRKNSKTDWPLKNIVGSGHRRKSSPIWDRIYEE